MPHNPAMLRFAPSVIGMTTFAVMAFLYNWNPALYLEILKGVGVPPWRYPFLDGEFMYAMKHVWLQGGDVYKSVPYGGIVATMPYSPLWQRLPMLPSDTAARVPIGMTTGLLLLISIAWLPPARSCRDAVLLSLATVSTMVWFALERNNIDVWIYLLIFVGGLLFSHRFLLRCISYLIFLFAGLLKYYPMILFLMAFRERASRFWVIALASLTSLILFWLGFRHELQAALGNLPAGTPFDMIGIVNIPLFVSLGDKAGEHASLQMSCRLWLTACVMILAYKLAVRPHFAASLARLPEAHLVWLMIGCLVMGGCYLAIQNVGYRGIYLLPVLSGLLALRRVTDDSRLRAELGRVTLAIVPIMWMEGIRYWAKTLALNVGDAAAIFIQLAFWLVREILWLYLACMMTAVVMSYLAQSTMGRSWYNHSLLIRKHLAFGSRTRSTPAPAGSAADPPPTSNGLRSPSWNKK
jgi:hypothetical protein